MFETYVSVESEEWRGCHECDSTRPPFFEVRTFKIEWAHVFAYQFSPLNPSF